MFAEILKRIFFNGSKSASIVIPKVGLSKLYVEKASQFIRKQSGTITTSERVLELVVQENKVKKIITDQNEYIDLIMLFPLYLLMLWINLNLLAVILLKKI